MVRREFLKSVVAIGASNAISFFLSGCKATTAAKENEINESVYLTDGFRLHEVSSESVIVWTRTCKNNKPNPVTHQISKGIYRYPLDFDENMPVAEMDGEVAGEKGYVKFILFEGDDFVESSSWQKTFANNDYVSHFQFTKLKPETEYKICLEVKKKIDGHVERLEGKFKTAPLSDSATNIIFTSASDQLFWDMDDKERGFRIYDHMRKLKPDFFVHNGDFVYYDKPGPESKNIEKARHKWHRITALPSLKDFFKEVPCYLLKDDHDTLKDDAHPYMEPYGELTFNDALSVWRENVPLNEKPYRTYRWGKYLQIWLLECREFRSDNTDKDSSKKTILGGQQKRWLVDTLSSSDAIYKLIFTPTPVVGPDADWKADNHANKAFATEGQWIRELLAVNKAIILNGDRHWQYVSVDPQTGLREYCHGPASDSHVACIKDSPLHRFKRCKGGFMSGEIYSIDGRSVFEITFYDTEGNVVYTEIINESDIISKEYK